MLMLFSTGMAKQKCLMIIGAGQLQLSTIEIAKEMGLKTIVTDYNPDAPGLRIADIPVIMSTRDIDGTVRAARQLAEKERVEGIMTVGTDASMTVAAVANALGLPGNKFEAAEAATNKIKMRSRFRQGGVPSPDFSECWVLEDTLRFAKNHKFPLVIKPSDNMGARGVKKINSMEELLPAFSHAKQFSPSGELIIEEYMDGLELSIDALIFSGRIVITGIADRMIDFDPYFVEIGHIMPSNLPESRQASAVEVMTAGIRALGLTLGAAKGDIKLTSRGAMAGEIAARLSGGFMSAYTYPLSTGVNLIRSAIKISLGQIPSAAELKPRFRKVSVEKAIIPQEGYVTGISGLEEARKVSGVKEIFLRIRPGEIVRSPTSNIEKAGNIISVARTRKEALRSADEGIRKIRIEVGPMPLVDEKEIMNRAQKLFNGSCFACRVCDGAACRGLVPGMGGVGSGSTFVDNYLAFKKYKINISVIHNVNKPDMTITLFGYRLSCPVLAAPITGTDINMNNALSELDYDKTVVDAFRGLGSIAMVGDGAPPDMYQTGLKAVREANGWGIPVFKPRALMEEILKRVKEAGESNSMAVGCDIDAVVFKTMKMAGQPTAPLDETRLKRIISHSGKPFIVKGIMTGEDAQKAVRAGAGALVVSNHGGRVLDSMPAAVDVLKEVASAVNKKIPVLVDGGIRTGLDVFKCLALGAHAVLIGRPVAVYAVGGGMEGIKFYMNRLLSELSDIMVLTGCRTVADIKPGMIRKE